MKPSLAALALFALAAAPSALLRADEGMWLINHPPLEKLKHDYGFEPSPAWLGHIQRSAVRFNSGGSGSFVSADGLIITNQHVGQDALEKLSNAAHDYVREGFYAGTRAGEVKCLDMELNVLVGIEDVTARVNAAVPANASPADAFAARRRIKARIEKESLDRTGLRSDVVTLYEGAQYHLYRYKRYTDVRLVFAPEISVASFGGDPDNFEYPRYDLDISIFRAYENGRPARPSDYLTWSQQGAADGELTFVLGNPGSTSREYTYAQLADVRDRRVPEALEYLKQREVGLLAWAARSDENARRAGIVLRGIQNARKLYDGRIDGLLGPELFVKKAAEEKALKDFAAGRPDLADCLGAWASIEAAQKIITAHATRMNYLEANGFRCTLFDIARTLVRAADERAKPSGERLREYRDSNRVSLELQLFSAQPIYDDLEQLNLSTCLTIMAQTLGPEDPAVRMALGGMTPSARAAQLIGGSRLKDPAYRRRLYALDAAQLAQVGDPLLALARAVDPFARTERKLIEEQGDVIEQAQARLARVRYAMSGTSVYPDATFTLRLAYGPLKGYAEGGRNIPALTNFAGLFQRSALHHNQPPFDLPPRWLDRQNAVDPATPLNFVSTADIIGGNSGSPVINRAGEFVGIIFDGNLQSLTGDYGYTDTQARAVSVDARGIIEAIRKVYGHSSLADELTGPVAERASVSSNVP